MGPIDLVVLAILGVAALRGLFRGLIRESLSIGALAGACVAIRLFATPLSARLADWSEGALSGMGAYAGAAVLLAVGVIALVALGSRLLQRGAEAAGLGWADRLGGGVLGVAEGALLSAVLLLGTVEVAGRDATLLAGSRSLAALDRLAQLAAGDTAGVLDVAAPPRAAARGDDDTES